MKIAQFNNIAMDFIHISTESFEGHPDYVRISEYIEIEFIPMEESKIVIQKVSIIDEQINNLFAEFDAKLGSLKQKKEELLALTHQGE